MRAKIGLAFGTLTLLLLLAAGLAISHLVSQRLETDTRAALLRAAHLVSVGLDREIQERRRDLMALAQLLDTQQALGPDAPHADSHRQMLKAFADRYGLQAVMLADSQGQVRLASEATLENQDLAKAPWFAQDRRAPLVSDASAALAQGLRHVDIVVPVGAGGVLVAQLAEPWVDTLRNRLRLLASPDQSSRLEVFVSTRDGRVLATHNGPATVPARSLAIAADSCARDASDSAMPYLSCAVVSEGHKDYLGLGWRVTMRLPEDVAFATAANLEYRIAWIGLLASVLFGVAGWLLADRISKPITAMAQAADRIASGERALALPQTGKDEVGQLARSLSSLLATLRQEEATLVRTNQALEARVAERTLKLEQAVSDLQDANTDLDRFTSMVTHDLLAPVRAMRTFSELLQMDFAEQMPAEAQRLLKRIDQAGLDMSNLVNALHALSKLGQKPLQVVAADMTAIAQQTVEANMPAWQGKRFDIATLPPSRCDPSMMRIVFDNLIGNAVKYSHRQAAPEISVGGEVNGDQHVYWVSDNGTGFDPQYAHRLFQIFQRLHSARDYPGTGVGLATVAKIISRHGGRVWADSSPGEGATFYFSLPAPDDNDAAVDTEAQAALAATGTLNAAGLNPPSA